jgi:phenylacetate-CoA ligase
MNPRFWDRRMETLPTERRLLLHDHRLHWQVRRCWDAAPWHRARFEQDGIDPVAFQGLRDLARIPLLTDADLRAATDTHDTAALAVAPQRWWARVDADASRPARVLTDGDVIHQADLAARALWAAGARPDREIIEQSGRLVIQGVAEGIARVQRRFWQSHGSAQIPFTVQIGTEPDLQDVDTIGMPPGLRWTTAVGGSTLHNESASNTPARAVSLPYVGPTLTYTCAEGTGLHWADDHLLVEIVDAVTYAPLPEGQAGAVVITELTREGTPLLRYWSGLEAALEAAPCPCGRTSARSPFVRPLTGAGLAD